MREVLDSKLEMIAVPDELHTACMTVVGRVRRMRIRRIAAAVAAVICVCILPAMASGLYGYYKEVRRGMAITGGVIVNADNDIALSVHIGSGGRLVLVIDIVNTEEIAYSHIDYLQLDGVTITDASGSEVFAAENVVVDMAVMEISLDAELIPGEYLIMVNGMTGLFKADASLPIQGAWQCVITVK